MFYEEQDESEEQYLKDSEARQKNLKMAHVMLDIAQNASIRGMRVDGEDRFSVYDLMNYVCGKDSKSTYAHRTFARISQSSDIQTDVCTNCTKHQIHRKRPKTDALHDCMAYPGTAISTRDCLVSQVPRHATCLVVSIKGVE